jgi:hypothetical protein
MAKSQNKSGRETRKTKNDQPAAKPTKKSPPAN